MGKEYGLNFFNMIKEYMMNDDGSNDTYFCSKLVAAAYIEMGLLPKTPPPSQYFPGHFSSSQNLNWLNEAYLDREYILEF